MTLRETLEGALADGTLISLTLSKPTGGESRKARVRPFQNNSSELWQIAITTSQGERHENHTAQELCDRADSLFGEIFRVANVQTTEADLELRVRPSGVPSVKRSPPSKTRRQDVPHDREKQHILREGEPVPFLIAAGVMTPEGRVKSARQKKFRQVNRFLEFVRDVLGDLPKSDPLRIVDFGCGKSLLTFAVHHLLTSRGRNVEMIGLDLKEHVVRDCRDLARKLELSGLEFRVGDIGRFSPAGDQPIDMVISLHACDTATDSALAQAVKWKAKVILAAPCCQHEVAAMLPKTPLLDPLLSHGVVKERFASLATDSLRAKLMELIGYRSQVVEFIETEHTPKNLLLRCRRGKFTAAEQRKKRRAYLDFKSLMNIETFALERELAADDNLDLEEAATEEP